MWVRESIRWYNWKGTSRGFLFFTHLPSDCPEVDLLSVMRPRVHPCIFAVLFTDCSIVIHLNQLWIPLLSSFRSRLTRIPRSSFLTRAKSCDEHQSLRRASAAKGTIMWGSIVLVKWYYVERWTMFSGPRTNRVVTLLSTATVGPWYIKYLETFAIGQYVCHRIPLFN